jgi:hypothetical protein
VGDYDVFEYAARSCTTVREAIDVISRYIPLISDAADFYQEVKDGKVYAWLHSRITLSRAVADFQSAAFFKQVTFWLGPDLPSEFDMWFEHPAPADLSGYRKVYGDRVLRFGTPCDGFVFDESVLDMKLRSADAKLHSVLRKRSANRVLRRQADQLLNELPVTDNLIDRVRQLILKQLAGRDLNIDRIAKQLGVSRRTLHRRLREEGITF